MDEHSDDCFLCRHPLWKTIFISLLVFAGAFAAFYVVTDWHYKRMLDPAVQMRKVEKMMQHDERNFDKMMNREVKKDRAIEKEIQKYIKVERNPHNYKIFIDLKPFDNNEKNIEVTTEGNSLTINAAGENKKHGRNEIVRISQTYSFNEDVELDKINKIREGNEYVIVIPIE